MGLETRMKGQGWRQVALTEGEGLGSYTFNITSKCQVLSRLMYWPSFAIPSASAWEMQRGNEWLREGMNGSWCHLQETALWRQPEILSSWLYLNVKQQMQERRETGSRSGGSGRLCREV